MSAHKYDTSSEMTSCEKRDTSSVDNSFGDISPEMSESNHIPKLISGIKDDIKQDSSEEEEYRNKGVPETYIAEELERISRKSTQIDLEANTPEEINIEENIPPPDKGYAWVIALISTLAIFASWGSNASFGVFLQYYLANDIFEGASKYDFALIGGMVVCLACGLCPLTTVMYRVLGLRITTGIGVVLQTAGYILASFATELWQLYACQGLIVGISFSMIFLPASLILPTWFVKHKAAAFGLFVSGTGLGGLVFSLSIHKVLDKTHSHRWGLRVAALLAFVSAFPCFFLKTRTSGQLPFKKRILKTFILENLKMVFDITVFKSVPLVLLGVWFQLTLAGFMVLLFSVASFSTLIGLTTTQATTLTAVLNAGQAVGRPIFGHVADTVGRSNASAVACIFVAVWIWAFWLNATTFGAMIPFCLILGLLFGIGTTMAQPLGSDIIDHPSKLAAAWCGLNVMVAITSLVSEVIALALVKSSGNHRFMDLQIFVGACFFAAGVLMFIIREALVTKTLRHRIEASHKKLENWSTPDGRYLTVEKSENTEKDQAEIHILNERIERHTRLLRGGIYGYFVRMFYPIKV